MKTDTIEETKTEENPTKTKKTYMVSCSVKQEGCGHGVPGGAQGCIRVECEEGQEPDFKAFQLPSDSIEVKELELNRFYSRQEMIDMGYDVH